MLLALLALAQTADATLAGHLAWLEEQRAAAHLPGLSVAVVRDGGLVLELGVGQAMLAPARAASARTIYPLYSVAKIFAGVAVLQQVEVGALALDAPASEVLDALPEGLGAVTLRHALGHTAGLRNWVDAPEWTELAPESRALLEGRDVLEIVAGLPRAFPQGERFAYSQSGYVLAGLALEQLTGKPYAAGVEERTFAKLGMGSARFGDLAALSGEDVSAIYELVDGQPRTKAVHFEAFVHPAAGLNASAHDLALFALALQAGTLLTPASTAELWREGVDGRGQGTGYGLGWVVDALDGHRRVGHEGGGAAWFWHFPGERLSVVVLTNLNGARADALVDDFCRRFL